MGKKRLQSFTNEQKIKLIKAVQKRPGLWNATYEQRRDSQWITVATEMEKSADECNAAWISLRHSYNYHCKKAIAEIKKRGKKKPNFWELNIEWKFAPYICFMADLKFPDLMSADADAVNTDEDDIIVKEEHESIDNSNGSPMHDESLYRDKEPKNSSSPSSSSSKRQRMDKADDKEQSKSCDKLTEIMVQFLKRQEELMAQQTETHRLFRNHNVFAYWDSIFVGMSASGAQNARILMTQLLQKLARNDQLVNSNN